MFDLEIYTQFYSQQVQSSEEDPQLPHRLSVMFMILAIGSLMDGSLPSYNIDAEKYHQLARAALFQHPFLDSPTISAVQALVRFCSHTIISLADALDPHPVLDDLLSFYY